ncbi:glycosyltransferase [Flavobacteriaceae bacterium Ap0902]|nr:glycosyltransferase [Flavobacteriaceae bacterium Ap0902]
MNNLANPLVSIIIITYNSSKFILETLESAKNQTYKNIELIISDDGSTDDTIAICENWLYENKNRFKRSELITVKKNTGIPANCNRGLRASSGEWFKMIAGDDSLIANCIESNIHWVHQHPEVRVLQTVSRYYQDILVEENYIANSPSDKHFFHKSAEQQYNHLKVRNDVIAPSVFINTVVIKDVGGYDEDFKQFEDITIWLKLTRSGYKIEYAPIETVNYRIHSDSVARKGHTYMEERQCRELLLFIDKYYDKSDKRSLYYWKKIIKLNLLIVYDKIGLNNKSKISKLIYKVTWKLLS